MAAFPIFNDEAEELVKNHCRRLHRTTAVDDWQLPGCPVQRRPKAVMVFAGVPIDGHRCASVAQLELKAGTDALTHIRRLMM
jgi:hypothetical protein